MSKMNLLVCVGACAMSGAAMAQFRITPGGANAGNGLFEITAVATTSLTGAGQGSANFRQFGAVTTGNPDHIFASAWWFRVNGVDTREYTFGNGAAAGGPSMTAVLVGDNTGNLDTGGWNYNVTGPGATAPSYAFTAQMRYQIFAGTGGPAVIQTALITNTGQSAINMSLFSYNDFDVNGTAGTDTYVHNGNWYNIVDGPSTVNWAGFGSTAYQATAFAIVRGFLSDALITNLNNTVAGSPGDFTGAYQWDGLALGVGQSVMVMGSFALNGDPIPAPGAAALLALGGLAGARRRR